MEMKFWETGWTPSEEHSYLTDVYGIPDYVTSVEHVFRVKHGVFSWHILNLSAFPDTRCEGVFCHSPVFRLLDTRWFLQLCPKALVNGRRGVSIRLVRGGSDTGPERVLASYRLGVGKVTDKIWLEARESAFRKGGSVQLDTSVLGYLEDFYPDGADDLSVVCEIYVSYFPVHDYYESREVSEIDESLPADMSALLHGYQHTTDVWIQVRDRRTRAHRCVLSARSKTLGSRLARVDFAQLSCSARCLECVLAYAYTGSFDYVARNARFGVGLYEVASELCLDPLRDLLAPERRGCVSRIHVESFETIHSAPFHLRAFLSGDVFSYRVPLPNHSGLRMCLSVYKIGRDARDYHAAFKMEISGVRGGFHAETSLHLVNRRRKGLRARCLSQELTDSGSLLTAIFVLAAAEFGSGDVARDFISVRVGFRMYEMLHDLVKSYVYEDCRPDGQPLEPWCWREQLAQDLKRLLHRGETVSDASVIAGEQALFKIHRPVLAARSPRFHSLLYGERNATGVYRLKELKPRTFWLMLSYAYCGTLSHLSDLTPRDFVELLHASTLFGLASSARICSIFLKMMTGQLDMLGA